MKSGAGCGAGVVAALVYSQMYPTFYTSRGLRNVIQRPVLGAVTFQNLGPARRKLRLSALAFLCGLAGLFAAYGSVLALLLLTARGA